MEFSKKAGSYEEHAVVQRDMVSWFLQGMGDGWAEGADVLELGCGTGMLSRELAKMGARSLLCTDKEETMIAKARELEESIEYRVMDACGIEGQYDWIVSTAMLQWFRKPQEMLRNWRRSLRPGGRVACGFFIDGSLRELKRICPEGMCFDFRPIDWWEECFKVSGYDLEAIEVSERVYKYGSGVEFFRQLHETGAYGGKSIEPARLRSVIREYEERGVKASWSFGRIVAS